MSDCLSNALDCLEECCEANFGTSDDRKFLVDDIPSNNIYTCIDNADDIDDYKVDSILSYLDHILITYYPTIPHHNPDTPSHDLNTNAQSQTDSTNPTSLRISEISAQIRPQLHRQLDLINEFPIDNNGLTWDKSLITATTTTTASDTNPSSNPPTNPRIKHRNYLNSKFDTLTTFDECEAEPDDLSFLHNTLPKSYNLTSTSSSRVEKSPTISLPPSILNTNWFQTLSDHFPNTFLQNGIHLPIHATSPTNPDGPFDFKIFLLRLASFIPIILISTLILFNWKVLAIDWFLTAFHATRTAMTNGSLSSTGNTDISISISITKQNPYALSLFPQILLSSTLLTHLAFLLTTLYVCVTTIVVVLIITSLLLSHFTSNSLHDHQPNHGYFAELQRRTIYTYYCLINHFFPRSDIKDSATGSIIAPAPPRSSFLITPFPALLPAKYTLSYRLKRMLLCEPDRFLSISRCSRCDKQIFRPPGTHHCGSCGCSTGFDHHCVFIGADVGTWSHKYFINFLFWASVGCTVYTPVGVYVSWSTVDKLLPNGLNGTVPASTSDLLVYPLIVFFCTMFTGAFALVLSIFTYFHLKLIMDDNTTFDNIMNPDEQRDKKDGQYDEYDGDFPHKNSPGRNKPLWERRLCRILGPSRLLWFVPIDTMYDHRIQQKKQQQQGSRIGLIPKKQRSSSFSPLPQSTYTKINASSLEGEELDDIEAVDDGSTSHKPSDPWPHQSPSTPAEIDDLDDLLAISALSSSFTRDSSVISPQNEIYFQQQLYLQDDYFYPYQFTHHFFPGLELLLPEHHGLQRDMIEQFAPSMLERLRAFQNISTSTANPHLVCPSPLRSQMRPTNPLNQLHNIQTEHPTSLESTTSRTSPTHATTAIYTPSKPKTLLPPPLSVSSIHKDVSFPSVDQGLEDMLAATSLPQDRFNSTFNNNNSTNSNTQDQLLDFLSQDHLNSEFDDNDTLSLASTFDMISDISDIEF